MRVERQANVQSLQSRAAALRSEARHDQREPAVSSRALRPRPSASAATTKCCATSTDKLLKDREELRLRGQVETERSTVKFEVVDPPSTPRVPAAPNRPLLLLGVLVVGLGAGAGRVAGARPDQGHVRHRGQSSSGTFDLPVIGTVSQHADRCRARAAGGGG